MRPICSVGTPSIGFAHTANTVSETRIDTIRLLTKNSKQLYAIIRAQKLRSANQLLQSIPSSGGQLGQIWIEVERYV